MLQHCYVVHDIYCYYNITLVYEGLNLFPGFGTQYVYYYRNSPNTQIIGVNQTSTFFLHNSVRIFWPCHHVNALVSWLEKSWMLIIWLDLEVSALLCGQMAVERFVEGHSRHIHVKVEYSHQLFHLNHSLFIYFCFYLFL